MNFIYLAKICTHKPKPDIVVAVVGVVVVAITKTEVAVIVVPTTAAEGANEPKNRLLT